VRERGLFDATVGARGYAPEVANDTDNGEGRVLAGRYRLDARIGAGGMGAVFRATDTRLEREVAVKLLPAEALGDQAARQRLIREALACAALRHPGIVHVYDVGETDDGGAFLVMELVVGTSLRALIDDASWSDSARLTAIIEAARALGAAHRAGLIHRDVKPDNLMLRDDGRVVLLDFGIAKPAMPGGDINLTGAGVVIGTPAYLSPEQARGRGLTARTDQFSLAVTAFELLSRALPWVTTSGTELVAAIMNDPMPPLHLEDASLADAVRPVLERAMAKKADDRYADADAFADALSSAVGFAPVPSAVPRSAVSQRDVGVAATDPLAATAMAEPTPAPHAQTVAATSMAATAPRRARRAWPIALGVAVAAGAATSVGVWRAHKNPLDVPFPVLACPMLEGSIDGKAAPWLGAAAAYALGDDVAPMLGGFDDHVRYPAHLLEMPGYVPDARVLDTWTRPALREQSVRAATGAGYAWLDGRIDVRGAQITLTVVVRAPTGRELGRASGSGSGLGAVALDVSRKLRATGGLGAPHGIDPEYRSWEGVGSPEEEDATTDLDLSMLDHAARQICDEPLPPRLPASWKTAIASGCAGTPLDLTLPEPALARAMAAQPSSITPEARERFHREIASARPGQRKALLLGTSLQMEDTNIDRDSNGTLAVVTADPRTGWNGLREGLGTANATLISNALAWAPDNHDWWLTATRALPPTDRATASQFLQRTFILLPNGAVAMLYADALLREGDDTDLPPVVAFLAATGVAVDRDIGRLVAARAAVLEGAFARTLRKWTEEMTIPPTILGEGLDANPRISSARELAYATSGERALANAVARALVEGTVTLRIPDGNVTIRPNLAALCALAEPSLATRCLAMLEPSESVAAVQREDWARVRDVVARYIAGDFAKAADLARGLTGSRYYPYYVVRLGDFLVDVFDRGGAPEMAEEIDRAHIDDRDLAGTSLAALRAARRAKSHGDGERARALAKRIVDSWKLVDMTVPAVAEMQGYL
jgi:hypothetical protein